MDLKKTVDAFWLDHFAPGARVSEKGQIILSRNANDDLQISYLKMNDYRIIAMNESLHAKFSNYIGKRPISEGALLSFTQEIGFRWNPPDLLFYADGFTFREKQNCPLDVIVRKLSKADAPAFDTMTAECSAADLDAGYVELEHTSVYGVFYKGKMVSQASAYAFYDDERIYDVGYITHPDFRQRGLGGLCASALTRDLLQKGKIAQIRAQPALIGSIGIAESIGYIKMGEWLYDEGE